jgi:hypothetical protein
VRRPDDRRVCETRPDDAQAQAGLTPSGRLAHNFAAMTKSTTEPRDSTASTLVRLAKFGLIIFGLIVVMFAFVAWLGGDQSTLPFNYDGFD